MMSYLIVQMSLLFVVSHVLCYVRYTLLCFHCIMHSIYWEVLYTDTVLQLLFDCFIS